MYSKYDDNGPIYSVCLSYPDPPTFLFAHSPRSQWVRNALRPCTNPGSSVGWRSRNFCRDVTGDASWDTVTRTRIENTVLTWTFRIFNTSLIDSLPSGSDPSAFTHCRPDLLTKHPDSHQVRHAMHCVSSTTNDPTPTMTCKKTPHTSHPL